MKGTWLLDRWGSEDNILPENETINQCFMDQWRIYLMAFDLREKRNKTPQKASYDSYGKGAGAASILAQQNLASND